ncbi:MAG: outer membrane protein transport protein, partial [Pseudomonadota bacterium]
ANTQIAHLEGDDYGFGWNIGAMYQLDENNRFGFNYRSETDIDFEGEYSNQLPAAFGGLAGTKVPGELKLTLPAIAEFSGSHQIDKKLGVHYSILWTGWDSFQKLEAYVPGVESPVFSKEENFSDSMRYSIGTDYQYSDALLLRAGIAYDESPADQSHLSISIPDTDRFWFSFGGNYAFSENSNVDLGVSILRGKTQNFSEKDSLAASLGQDVSWEFESKGHAVLVGAQYNYKF